MECLQLIFSEILQCEKAYEITLRRIAAYKSDVTLNASLNTFQPGAASTKLSPEKLLNQQTV